MHSALWQAVIGAGAAGLVAARELHREGHRPTVFEQGTKVGGVWVYTDEIEEPHAATGLFQLPPPTYTINGHIPYAPAPLKKVE